MSASPIVVGPATGHTHTIILLHGRDSEAQEFASEFFECEDAGGEHTLQDLFPTVRWVFPQARFLQSERFNIEMSQWFDMWSVENQQERVELQIPGLRASVDRIASLIEEEEVLVPRSRIFLGGISQGFATILATFLSDGRGGFAGLCGFSSWLPLADHVESEMKMNKGGLDQQLAAIQRLYLGGDSNQQVSLLPSQLQSTSVLLEHCQDDDIIAVENGQRMRELLVQLGLSAELREYVHGGHWINEPDGVDDFIHFLRGMIDSAA
ncbi:Alpha/Beta hydrolase protein [Trichoderma chlorosporum]